MAWTSPVHYHRRLKHTITHNVKQSRCRSLKPSLHLGPLQTPNGLRNTLYLASPNLRARRLQSPPKPSPPAVIYAFCSQAPRSASGQRKPTCLTYKYFKQATLFILYQVQLQVSTRPFGHLPQKATNTMC